MSQEARQENFRRALKLMMEDVGDEHAEACYIETANSKYDDIHTTTWKELDDRRLIRPVADTTVTLTVEGWRFAVIEFGLLEVGDFRGKLGVLSATLKGALVGRQVQALIATQVVAEQAGLNWGFVANTVRSHLLDEVFNIVGASMDSDYILIRVPINYGHRPLEI